MASIVPGYEYDIFISYRQKDNKHDGWVTEFVNQLKGELESTFKEEISVYFDINSHDGILETYDVDESLKDKLKCLVFIPIISRTYCDPKSFAWEHEFKTFVEQTSVDRIGLKVKLPNGNVANRILPIQIHEITAYDKANVEMELGGVLRAIEFIYKEPGVNRPLTPYDDEKININKTRYRNQINKVANAIDEVIHSLSSLEIKPDGRKLKYNQPLSNANEEAFTKKISETAVINHRTRKYVALLLSGILFIIGAFAVIKIMEVRNKDTEIVSLEKSIAVLPFINLSNDPQQEDLSEGMRQEILNHLFKIGGLKIPSGSSTMRFKVSELSVRDIARKLGVTYVLEGNVSKSDSNVRIIVTLINGKNEHVVWTEDYKRSKTATDILEIQSEVALQVAASLKVVIDPEVRKRINARPTENTEAYSLYLQVQRLWLESYQQGMQMLEKAVVLDPGFADAYALMAFWRMWYMGDSLSRDQILGKVEPLLNKAMQLDSNSLIAHNVLAELKMWYYWDLEEVEKDFQIVKQLSPSNPDVFFGFTQYLWLVGRSREAFTICKDIFEKDDVSEYKWVYMALAYGEIGDHKKAIETIESAMRLFPDNNWIYSHAISIYIEAGRYEEAINLFEKNNEGKSLKELDDDVLGGLGISYFKTGNRIKANIILNELLSRNKNFARNESSFYAATIYVAMGEKNNALTFLENAYTERELVMIKLKQDPNFRPLSGDPRFENLLLKIGFK